MTLHLSIILPVYNVAAYLEKCVQSCFTQDISTEKYEVIIVNDGSTDESLALAEKLRLAHPQLKIINQENKGLSGARNTGLKLAKGDYVWFVDSDDWIETNCLQNIIDQLVDRPDMLWQGHSVWQAEKKVKDYIPKPTSHSITGEELFSKHLDNLFYIWKFIYQRAFLESNKLLFYEGILYEDLEFTPRALAFANTCITLPKATYHYLVREGSIANHIKVKNIEHRFFILNKLVALTHNTTIGEDFKQALTNVIYHTTEGTVGLAARAGIKIPKNGFLIFQKLRHLKPSQHIKTFKIRCIQKLPRLYYYCYTNSYKIYKILLKITK